MKSKRETAIEVSNQPDYWSLRKELFQRCKFDWDDVWVWNAKAKWTVNRIRNWKFLLTQLERLGYIRN